MTDNQLKVQQENKHSGDKVKYRRNITKHRAKKKIFCVYDDSKKRSQPYQELKDEKAKRHT